MIKIVKKCNIYALFTFVLLIFAFFTPVNGFYNEGLFAKCEHESLAKAMVVIEKNSGRILYSKNENERLPMASLTKIITAIYTIKNCENIDEKHEISQNSVGVEGTSIGLKTGEHLSVRELLYGLMLRSGNDSAVALSIIISGSQDQFVKDVNEWLLGLGFKDTQIMNPHGLHHEEHYTTAYELAKITAIALDNPIFREIVSTKEKVISNELKSKTSRNLKNKNRFLKEYEYADGVKTGFTKKAGRCFVGSSTKDGMQVICVLLNCVPMFEECQRLTQKAYNEYSLVKLVKKDELLASINVNNLKGSRVDVVMPNDFYYPLKEVEEKDVKIEFSKKEDLSAPINQGDELGTLKITFENQLIFSDKIYSIKYINSDTFDSKLSKVLEKM